ncbi:MAG: hypothetical protein Q7R95_01070 [bacterium]|nr:hypothetical protein [bacterium]
MKPVKIPIKIPASLHRFFWDVDVKKLNPAEKPYFVISRLLDKGNVEAVKWVRTNFSEQEIKKVFATIRDFSPEVGSLWSIMLQIPRNEVLCLQQSYLQMRKTHWPY